MLDRTADVTSRCTVRQLVRQLSGLGFSDHEIARSVAEMVRSGVVELADQPMPSHPALRMLH